MKSNRALDEIHVMVIYSRDNLVAVTSEWSVKRVICKTWTGTLANSPDPDQTPQNAASDQSPHCLLNYRKLRIKRNSLTYPYRTIFPAYTQRHSTYQCSQCFDYYSSQRLRVFKWQVINLSIRFMSTCTRRCVGIG